MARRERVVVDSAGFVLQAAWAVTSTSPPPSATVNPMPTSCCTHGPTAAAGALTGDVAISIALAAVPSSGGTLTVVWARPVDNPVRRAGGQPETVWAVRLQGSIAAPSCPPGELEVALPPSAPPCLDNDGRVNVTIDPFPGAVLGWCQ